MPKKEVYSETILRETVAGAQSMAAVMRQLGIRPAGGSHTYLSRKIKKLGIDTTHFLGKGANRGTSHKGGSCKKPWNEILVLRSAGVRGKSAQLTRALREMGREYKCHICNVGPIWRGKALVLQVEHINKNWLDNRPENLMFLCPNCHSQTYGWCGKK